MFHLLIAVLFAVQPLPEVPVTTFTQSCYTLADDGGFTVHIGYASNAERHFIGDGLDFVTQVGEHPDALSVPAGYLPAPDVAYISLIEVVTTGDPALDVVSGSYGEQIVIFIDWSTLQECGKEIELPNPLPSPAPYNEPMPVELCDRWAIDGSTGEPYCYTPTDGGIIPLPPPQQ